MDILPFKGHPDLALPYSVFLVVELLFCWSFLLKIDRELYFLKVERFSFGNVKMAKLSERLLSTNIPH